MMCHREKLASRPQLQNCSLDLLLALDRLFLRRFDFRDEAHGVVKFHVQFQRYRHFRFFFHGIDFNGLFSGCKFI